MRKRKQTIKLNNVASLQGLMQEAYNDTCGQILDAQKTINELTLTVPPDNVDEVTKIAREKSNALKIKDSSIKLKLEISKLMNDIIKTNGDLSSAEETKVIGGAVPTIDELQEIRDMLAKK